ncbi:MAG: peptidylprolyl isomerase, partial [Bacteroidota bacterium]
GFTSVAQPAANVIDQVAAVVGSKIVLKSEIEQQYQQYLQQGNYAGTDIKCRILDQLMLTKLLLNQAILDSVVVTDDEVNQKIEQNLSYFISQLGSPERLEEYYGKSIPELKEEFKPIVKDQLLAQKMQGTVTKGLSASPLDVKNYFESINKDSLPLVNAELEYSQIIRNVPITDERKKEAHKQLTDIRDRILKGEDFGTLAFLYSQDKESAKQNGELGLVNRGDLVPEFEAAAFRLKNTTDISPIVESKFGYHIIQLIERRGEKINVRHILIKPAVTPDDVIATQQVLDSVARELRTGSLKFAEAAEKFSDDTDSKLNSGIVANPSNGAIRFQSSDVEPSVLFQLDKLEPGELSNPMLITTHEGGQAYRILKLNARSAPHALNMNDDYQKLQENALQQKQIKTLQDWKNKKKVLTYINIADDYKSCDNLKSWSSNN